MFPLTMARYVQRCSHLTTHGINHKCVLERERTHTWTLDIHEIGIRALYETLLLVPPSLLLRGGVQQVFCELWIFNDFN